jgi:hypothetical protein
MRNRAPRLESPPRNHPVAPRVISEASVEHSRRGWIVQRRALESNSIRQMECPMLNFISLPELARPIADDLCNFRAHVFVTGPELANEWRRPISNGEGGVSAARCAAQHEGRSP